MKLGFDLDEVVVDLLSELKKYLYSNYGMEWPAKNCFVYYDFAECTFHCDEDLNKRITEDMINLANDANFQFQAFPHKDAVKAIQKLKKIGHKIYFITSRPKQNQPLTFKWLRKYNVPFDGLEVIGQNEPKGFYGRKHNLDMYVDDLLFHLESMFEYKKRWKKGLLLIDKPWNNDYLDINKFKRVYTWQEILRCVGVSNR